MSGYTCILYIYWVAKKGQGPTSHWHNCLQIFVSDNQIYVYASDQCRELGDLMAAGRILRLEEKRSQLKAAGEGSKSSGSSEDGSASASNDNSESGFRYKCVISLSIQS